MGICVNAASFGVSWLTRKIRRVTHAVGLYLDTLPVGLVAGSASLKRVVSLPSELA
jgi:hypothetical protein